jgi:hypothetical protein
MGANAAQLTAAVSALINALVASKFSTQGALGLMNTISYARWGLEGYVIAEANCLKGECGTWVGNGIGSPSGNQRHLSMPARQFPASTSERAVLSNSSQEFASLQMPSCSMVTAGCQSRVW